MCAHVGAGLTPYDIAASTIILKEAGCIAEPWQGAVDFSQKKIPFIAATDSALAREITKIITENA